MDLVGRNMNLCATSLLNVGGAIFFFSDRTEMRREQSLEFLSPVVLTLFCRSKSARGILRSSGGEE